MISHATVFRVSSEATRRSYCLLTDSRVRLLDSLFGNRPLAANWAIAIACAALAIGCGEKQPELQFAPLQKIDLTAQLDYAKISGTPPELLPEDAEGLSRFKQFSDTKIEFGVLLPWNAMIRAGLTLADGGNLSAEDLDKKVRVTFINQVGERHLVPSVVPKEGEATRNWNLTRWGGQAGAVEIEPISRAGDGGLSSALEWRNLRVEEVRRRGLAGADFPRQQYNVIVILLDSLRPDYLASYGNQDVDSRSISKLSRFGVTFDDAQSNSSWTRPSVASMFTSALPWVHQADEINSKLRSDISYLPEILNQAGYRTECAIGTAMVSEGFGFDRGYDRVHNLWDPDEHRLPAKPIRRAEVLWKYYLEPLTKGDQPYFFFLHEVDPHSPYTPFGRFRPDLSTPLPRRIVTGRSHEIAQIRSNPDGITATELELMKGLYAGEVSGMDAQIGALLKQADAANALENTLVIFVSDHGEEFLDHRSAGHGHSVYRELLRVPLIMRLDRVFIRGLRVAAPVELRDIAPTVLDLVGIDIPADMDGRSLVHLLAGGRFSDSRPVMASSGKPLLYSIRFGAMKLITPPPSSDVINEKAQLFNVYADPNEQTNIINRFPIVREALHQTLRAHLDLKFGVTEREYADISDEMRENLKALGYLEK